MVTSARPSLHGRRAARAVTRRRTREARRTPSERDLAARHGVPLAGARQLGFLARVVARTAAAPRRRHPARRRVLLPRAPAAGIPAGVFAGAAHAGPQRADHVADRGAHDGDLASHRVAAPHAGVAAGCRRRRRRAVLVRHDRRPDRRRQRPARSRRRGDLHQRRPAADPRHVRVVPEESAIFAGEKVVGQLGAYYRVGTYNVQSENGRLVWVAPLDFQGPVQWLSRHTSPGVVIVDAENPDKAAELRARAPLAYVPSALLNTNLRRHVWLRYGTELLLEETLQLDAQGNPRYLVTLGRPTIGWSGEKVTAVVIVDPATGAMERIPRDQFERLPAWVSRVYPPDLVVKYNDWFGRYVHGWWNAAVTKRDVHLPAREDVFGILLAD